MRSIQAFALAWLLAAAAIAPAAAAPAQGLYDASVPVPDQSPRIREQALQQALEAVLVRLTGDRRISANPAALPILSRATALIVGYGYEPAPGGAQGLQLRAQFDPRALEAALHNQGLPVWGPNRFSHLAWIAVRDDGQPRAVLDARGAAARAGALAAVAEQRGVLLQFPEMDVSERRSVTFSDLWNGQYTGVATSARRYNADQVLVARAGRDGSRWLVRWALLDGVNVVEEWTSSALASLDEAFAEGLHQLADRAAQRYAVVRSGRAEELVVRIEGVRSLADYGRALNYLRGLNPVRGAQPDRVDGDTATFRVRLEGEADMLDRVIAAGRVLQKREEGGLFASSLSYVLVH